MNCPRCGKLASAESRYCVECGSPLAAEVGAPETILAAKTQPTIDNSSQLALIESRLGSIEQRLNSISIVHPKFWKRAWAAVGYTMACWAIIYAVFFVIAMIIALVAAIAEAW